MSSSLKQLALWALPIAFMTPGVVAQSQEKLQENYQKKIGSDWFVTGGWSDDYGACRAKAKKEGKVILAYFTRSYSP